MGASKSLDEGSIPSRPAKQNAGCMGLYSQDNPQVQPIQQRSREVESCLRTLSSLADVSRDPHKVELGVVRIPPPQPILVKCLSTFLCSCITLDMKTKLNLGCGAKKLHDHHNVDMLSIVRPDEIVDLDIVPWPWPDNSFNVITAKNILEHLGPTSKDFLNIVKEMYRVSRPDALWDIAVPHWRCDVALDDPTHVRMITQQTFVLFDQQKNSTDWRESSSTSMLGFACRVDLEVVKVDYDIIPTWQEKLKNGDIGYKEFQHNLNHLNNICVETKLQIKAHKPERCKEWIEAFLVNTKQLRGGEEESR